MKIYKIAHFYIENNLVSKFHYLLHKKFEGNNSHF